MWYILSKICALPVSDNKTSVCTRKIEGSMYSQYVYLAGSWYAWSWWVSEAHSMDPLIRWLEFPLKRLFPRVAICAWSEVLDYQSMALYWNSQDLRRQQSSKANFLDTGLLGYTSWEVYSVALSLLYIISINPNCI